MDKTGQFRMVSRVLKMGQFWVVIKVVKTWQFGVVIYHVAQFWVVKKGQFGGLLGL